MQRRKSQLICIASHRGRIACSNSHLHWDNAREACEILLRRDVSQDRSHPDFLVCTYYAMSTQESGH